MPTGYTAALYDGDQTFEDFVWNVARGFGALVTMRDAPADAPIPEEFAPSTYHDEKLAEARDLLVELDDMSVAEAEERSKAEHLASVERLDREREKREAIRQRYEAMLAQAVAWEPPTADHIALKETMVEQLEKAIDFDCREYSLPVAEKLDAQAWVDKERARCEKDIAHHAAEREKEIERARQRTAWVKALRDSLGAVHA